MNGVCIFAGDAESRRDVLNVAVTQIHRQIAEVSKCLTICSTSTVVQVCLSSEHYALYKLLTYLHSACLLIRLPGTLVLCGLMFYFRCFYPEWIEVSKVNYNHFHVGRQKLMNF